MPFPRTCERCKKNFEVKSRILIGRFCSKICMDEWQRTCKWEDRVGQKIAKKIRKNAEKRWIENNPNSDPRVLKIKSEKTTEYRKTHPLTGKLNPFYGKRHSEKLKRTFKKERKGKRSYNEEQFKRQNKNTPKGENHPMWKGGISYLPYDANFNKIFKMKVKERDGNRCVECEKSEKLAVHHIDYNKQNSVSENCISLCFSCHGRTNVIDRDAQTKYFREKYKNQLKKILL